MCRTRSCIHRLFKICTDVRAVIVQGGSNKFGWVRLESLTDWHESVSIEGGGGIDDDDIGV